MTLLRCGPFLCSSVGVGTPFFFLCKMLRGKGRGRARNKKLWTVTTTYVAIPACAPDWVSFLIISCFEYSNAICLLALCLLTPAASAPVSELCYFFTEKNLVLAERAGSSLSCPW